MEDTLNKCCKFPHLVETTSYSLLYGLPQHLILRLQSIQNTAARVVTRTKKFDHIPAVFKQLHWLPVRYRIVFKVLLLVYEALNGTAPPPTSVNYLSTAPLNGT